jgi:hypothetical protein
MKGRQLVEEPRVVMQSHDPPMDDIATEAELSVTGNTDPRPQGVAWALVQPDQFACIPFCADLGKRITAGQAAQRRWCRKADRRGAAFAKLGQARTQPLYPMNQDQVRSASRAARNAASRGSSAAISAASGSAPMRSAQGWVAAMQDSRMARPDSVIRTIFERPSSGSA